MTLSSHLPEQLGDLIGVGSGVAWSELFNDAIAANCRWRLEVRFPEYIEGGGEGDCATHNSWWPSHTRVTSGILRKLLSPLIILADERDRRLGTSPGRPCSNNENGNNFQKMFFFSNLEVNLIIALR